MLDDLPVGLPGHGGARRGVPARAARRAAAGLVLRAQRRRGRAQGRAPPPAQRILQQNHAVRAATKQRQNSRGVFRFL